MKKKHLRKRKKFNWSYFLKTFTFLGAFILLFGGLGFYIIKSRETPSCANSITCIKDLSGKYEPTKEGVFLGKKVAVPSYLGQGEYKPNLNVLGQESDNKHISVDLTSQQLFAYEGDRLVLNFPISSGKWFPTPTGDFHIWIKLRYTRMEGGNPAIGTYYNLPNVPYTMYFYNNQIPKTAGFGLHGAYWHNNFGHPMSHGCINISPANSELLYNWADPPTAGYTTFATSDTPGTPLTIYGVTPST